MSEKTVGEALRRSSFMRAIQLLEGLGYITEREASQVETLIADLKDISAEARRYEKSCDRMGERRGRE